MWRCTFCRRPATGWIWLIRLRVANTKREATSEQDVRVFSCSLCRTRLAEGRLFLRDGWAYGADAAQGSALA